MPVAKPCKRRTSAETSVIEPSRRGVDRGRVGAAGRRRQGHPGASESGTTARKNTARSPNPTDTGGATDPNPSPRPSPSSRNYLSPSYRNRTVARVADLDSSGVSLDALDQDAYMHAAAAEERFGELQSCWPLQLRRQVILRLRQHPRNGDWRQHRCVRSDAEDDGSPTGWPETNTVPSCADLAARRMQ